MFNVRISMASWLMSKCSLPSLQQQHHTCTLNTWKKGILSHFWNLQPVDPTKQHVEHMERFRMSSDAWNFRPFGPCQTHGLRYEESCHAEPFLKFTSPRPYLASTSFNIWTNLARWIIVKDPLPCALQKYTFKVVQQTDPFGILRRV